MVVFLVLGIALVLLASIGGAYIVGLHEGKVGTQVAIRAYEKASEGRSRALCGALLFLAKTPDAHKLHPAFQKVYDNSGCVRVSGKR